MSGRAILDYRSRIAERRAAACAACGGKGTIRGDDLFAVFFGLEQPCPACCAHPALFARAYDEATCLICNATFDNRERLHPRYKPCAACGSATCACGCGTCNTCERTLVR